MKAFFPLPEADKPSTSYDKLQQWVVRSSNAAGVNLQGFYEDWGFPLSDETKQTIGVLPTWDANPMDAFD